MRRILTIIFIALFVVIVGEMGYFLLLQSQTAKSAATQQTPISAPDPTPFAPVRYQFSQDMLDRHVLSGLDVVYHINAQVTEVDTVPGETAVPGMFDIKIIKPTPPEDAPKEPYLFRIYLLGVGENNKGQEYVYYHKEKEEHLIKFVDTTAGAEQPIKGTDLKAGDLIETTHVYDMAKPDNYSSLVGITFNRVKRAP